MNNSKAPYMSSDEIAMWVIKHNPGKATLYYNNVLQPVIKTEFPIDKMKLPPGCYYNTKNGITNKGNTETGLYTSLKVEN